MRGRWTVDEHDAECGNGGCPGYLYHQRRSPTVIDAAGQRMADTITWLLPALFSATTRDQFDFIVAGAPPELLSVMRSLDPDGLIPDVSSPATSAAGGGSGPYLTASASGDDRQHTTPADLPVAGPSLLADRVERAVRCAPYERCAVLLGADADIDGGPWCWKPAVRRLPGDLDFPVCQEHSDLFTPEDAA